MARPLNFNIQVRRPRFTRELVACSRNWVYDMYGHVIDSDSARTRFASTDRSKFQVVEPESDSIEFESLKSKLS